MSDRVWALILGVSSGFGAAAARAFAQEGYDIFGVHLDRRAAADRIAALVSDLRSSAPDRRVYFFNENAANDASRAKMIGQFKEILAQTGGHIRVLLHSLAFGTLRPYIYPPDDDRHDRPASRKQIEMTVDVMANSLVYWSQDLVEAALLKQSRIFAMTSAGSQRAWHNYGPVSAAKAALEAHVRQLCLELAPHGHTVNAIMAGVTDTPALQKIPNSEALMGAAIQRNPHRRLTRPDDVAACLIELARPGTYWMTGNVICVDGGEDACA
ncbi:MAG: SDR family oxidoreductase [Myxococcota bacterium]